MQGYLNKTGKGVPGVGVLKQKKQRWFVLSRAHGSEPATFRYFDGGPSGKLHGELPLTDAESRRIAKCTFAGADADVVIVRIDEATFEVGRCAQLSRSCMQRHRYVWCPASPISATAPPPPLPLARCRNTVVNTILSATDRTNQPNRLRLRSYVLSRKQHLCVSRTMPKPLQMRGLWRCGQSSKRLRLG